MAVEAAQVSLLRWLRRQLAQPTPIREHLEAAVENDDPAEARRLVARFPFSDEQRRNIEQLLAARERRHDAGSGELPHRGPVAQLVEQGTFNPKVAGSIPARPTSHREPPGAAHRFTGKQVSVTPFFVAETARGTRVRWPRPRMSVAATWSRVQTCPGA